MNGPATPTTDAEQSDFARLAVLLLQLAGIVWIVRRFEIESAAFVDLTTLAAGGFVVHYFLPLRYRVPFFLIISLLGIGLVLGAIPALWLIGAGLALVGMAHLPVPLRWRVVGLLMTAGVLLLMRAGRIPTPWPDAIWPVLASMFMFRLIVYMYDQATGQGGASLWQRLSYFFLLPNVCFPLFPVVDFRTFVRTHYTSPRHEVYQTGLDWIVRGIVQLLLYRIVQLWVGISPYDVDNLVSLGHYFVWLYLLYLSISGQFHVIVGMLHLFGFNLPETHRRYYLASSFTDFWRRINIYWKDFMMKVFYYPIYFRLRRLGPTPALVLSTAAVFVLTWFLHAYQGFWIRGFFHFSWNDTLFWAILGALVIVTSLREARRGRARRLSTITPGFRERLTLGLRTAATFVALCLLWGFWSSESVASWLSLWPASTDAPNAAEWAVAIGVLTAVAVTLLVGGAARRFGGLAAVPGAVRTGTWLVVLAAASLPAVQQVIGPAGPVLASVRTPRLNAFQLEQLERGYYEDLLVADRFNRELASLYSRRPPEWEQTLGDLGAALPNREPGHELLPGADVVFKGARFRTNRWGMHDQDYTLEPAPDVYRIALLGASHVMGMGVERHQSFEAVLEDRLNGSAGGVRTGSTRYEVLNFANQGYTAIEHLRVLEGKVAAFKPHAVWYVGHPYELKRIVRYVRRTAEGARPADRWPAMLTPAEAWAERAGVRADTSEYLAERRFARLGEEMFAEIFSAITGLAHRSGMQPVYIHMPLTPESRNEPDATPYVRLAERAGFRILDLTGVYDGHSSQDIWIADWDAHPNELGHRLVADRLYSLIQANRVAYLTTSRGSPPRNK